MNLDREFKKMRVSSFQRQCVLFYIYLYVKVALPQGQGDRTDVTAPSEVLSPHC